MSKRKDRPFIHRIAIDIVGFSLIIAGVLFGWIPGPGGVPLIVAGLAVLSLNYEWAEKAIKNFEQKYEEYVDRFLVKNHKVSLAVDMLSLGLTIGGFYVAVTHESTVPRTIGIVLISLSAVTFLSNRRRFDRLKSKIRNKR